MSGLDRTPDNDPRMKEIFDHLTQNNEFEAFHRHVMAMIKRVTKQTGNERIDTLHGMHKTMESAFLKVVHAEEETKTVHSPEQLLPALMKAIDEIERTMTQERPGRSVS